MKQLRILFLLTVSLHLISHQSSSQQLAGRIFSGGKLHPLQAIMDIRHYTLSLNVDAEARSIDGSCTVDLVLSSPADTLLLDLVRVYKIESVQVDGHKALFTHAGDRIYITSKQSYTPGRHSVKIAYAGQPPVATRPPWEGGFTWTESRDGFPWIVINCQMAGGKVYFPCKDHPSDEPNEGADLYITVPSPLVVAGPGLLKNVSTKGKKSTYHWKTNYTISNYCILFNVGKYKRITDSYTTIDGNVVPMEYFILEEYAANGQHVLDLRKRDTRILEKYFGEYPWAKEKIGIAQVANPGMEHQTMITFGDRFNYQHIGGQDYSANLYHEFGHEWWANKVTNRDWAHMWIQEGIDTYAEALAMRELAGDAAYDSIMEVFRLRIDNKKPVVQGEEVNTGDTYTRDIYFKGAVFMNMLRRVIGDSLFFPALKELATSPSSTYDSFVVTRDVDVLFSKYAGYSLTPFFDFFLRTTDRLQIEVTQVKLQEYQISIPNAPISLPVDVVTDGIRSVVQLGRNPVRVSSRSIPQIDPTNIYLKEVIQR